MKNNMPKTWSSQYKLITSGYITPQLIWEDLCHHIVWFCIAHQVKATWYNSQEAVYRSDPNL